MATDLKALGTLEAFYLATRLLNTYEPLKYDDSELADVPNTTADSTEARFSLVPLIYKKPFHDNVDVARKILQASRKSDEQDFEWSTPDRQYDLQELLPETLKEYLRAITPPFADQDVAVCFYNSCQPSGTRHTSFEYCQDIPMRLTLAEFTEGVATHFISHMLNYQDRGVVLNPDSPYFIARHGQLFPNIAFSGKAPDIGKGNTRVVEVLRALDMEAPRAIIMSLWEGWKSRKSSTMIDRLPAKSRDAPRDMSFKDRYQHRASDFFGSLSVFGRPWTVLRFLRETVISKHRKIARGWGTNNITWKAYKYQQDPMMTLEIGLLVMMKAILGQDPSSFSDAFAFLIVIDALSCCGDIGFPFKLDINARDLFNLGGCIAVPMEQKIFVAVTCGSEVFEEPQGMYQGKGLVCDAAAQLCAAARRDAIDKVDRYVSEEHSVTFSAFGQAVRRGFETIYRPLREAEQQQKLANRTTIPADCRRRKRDCARPNKSNSVHEGPRTQNPRGMLNGASATNATRVKSSLSAKRKPQDSDIDETYEGSFIRSEPLFETFQSSERTHEQKLHRKPNAHLCPSDGCNFRSSRRDNLRTHWKRIHHPKPLSSELEPNAWKSERRSPEKTAEVVYERIQKASA